MATSGTFGVVDTDNNAAVTGYQWEESATGGGAGFGDMGTIIIDISNAATTEVTVNSSTVAMNGTYVRCRADHLDGPSYSDEVQLTVT